MTAEPQATPTEPAPPTAATPRPRRRFQFSLATLLWLTTLVACLAALWPMYQRLRKAKEDLLSARAEISECHEEMSWPEVSDKTKVYARVARTWAEYSWNWRVYIPEQQSFRFCVSTSQIPVDGCPHWTDSIKLEPGVHWLGISLSSHTGTVELHTENTTRYTDQKMPTELNSPYCAGIHGDQKLADAGDPLVLLKESKRATASLTPKGCDKSEATACDGLMIWIEPASRFSRSSTDRY
jgi:hypothetical protein